MGYCHRHFSEIIIKIQSFSLTKMHLKLSSVKWRPFCPGGDEWNNKTMYIFYGIYCTQQFFLWAGPPSKTPMLSLPSIMDHYLMWMGGLNETPACKTVSQGTYIPATAVMGIMLVLWCKLAILELNIWHQFIIQQWFSTLHCHITYIHLLTWSWLQ